MPQNGLSICLSDPTAGQSQLPEQLASEHLLCAGSGWMLHMWYLNVTNSDLLIQMRFIIEVKDLSRILAPI